MFIFTTSFTTSTLLLSFLATTTAQVVGSECSLLESNTNGTCIAILDCPYALELLKTKATQLLRKIQCGWKNNYPLVCCPTGENYSNNLDVVRFTTPPLPTRPLANRPAVTTPGTPPAMTTAGACLDTKKILREQNTTADTQPIHTNPDEKVIDEIFNDSENGAEKQNITDERLAHTTPSSKNFSISEPSPVALLPDRHVCGTKDVTDRIHGGEIAGIYEFPWIARIKYRQNNRDTYACAGSLISERYILTAAHCVSSRYPIIGVRLGEWDTETIKDCYEKKCNDPPVDLQVENIIVHPNYKLLELNSDIALVRLDRTVNFTSFVRPVCLPTTSFVAGQDYMPDTKYVTAGWGKTEFGLDAKVLQKVYLKSVSIDICKVSISKVTTDSHNLIICAGGRKGEDSCKGDSGGPLVKDVTENYTNNWYLFGVTSFGLSRCGTEGVPSVYTRVAPYMEWILSNMY